MRLCIGDIESNVVFIYDGNLSGSNPVGRNSHDPSKSVKCPKRYGNPDIVEVASVPAIVEIEQMIIGPHEQCDSCPNVDHQKQLVHCLADQTKGERSYQRNRESCKGSSYPSMISLPGIDHALLDTES
jgi:hypothetical protein